MGPPTISPTMTPDISGLLTNARAQTMPALRAAIDQLPPDVAAVCRYHFGWRDESDRSDGAVDGSGGKVTRATLVLATTRGLGGSERDALPVAVAVELVHNWTLLHDDIIDRDTERRGRPSTWRVYGSSMALLAGDALLAAAYAALEPTGAKHSTAVRLLGEAVTRLIAGEVRELSFDQTSDQPLDGGIGDYLEMAAGKVSSLLESAVALGALTAGTDEAAALPLRSATRHLGIAWQAANDVEDIWGDRKVTGKPARGDLRQAHRTLPVRAALASGTDAGAELAKRWNARRRDDDHLDHVATLIANAGGRREAERISRHHLDTALELLEQTELSASARAELRGLFRLVVTRDTRPHPRRAE